MPTEKVLKKVHEDALHGNFFIYIHVSFFENKIYGFQMHAKVAEAYQLLEMLLGMKAVKD
jgi:hypothetical protein